MQVNLDFFSQADNLHNSVKDNSKRFSLIMGKLCHYLLEQLLNVEQLLVKLFDLLETCVAADGF